MMADFEALRRNMVDCQLRTYDVTDRRVLSAMAKVPREVFVPEARREIAYIDQPVDLGHGRALLPPMTVGRMLQNLDLAEGAALLDVAGGTGYTAALAAEMGAKVTLFEPEAALHERARMALATVGHPDVQITGMLPSGRFDFILVNGACEDEPRDLMAMLADGGRIVFVHGLGRSGRVMLCQSSHGVIGGRAVFDAAAPALAAWRRKAEFAL
jgi:protein-L-isoaspartate(D-aspartate) O-methyltransferase